MAEAANLLLEMGLLGTCSSGNLPWIGQAAQQAGPADSGFQELVATLLGGKIEDAGANELQAGQQVLVEKHVKKPKPEQDMAQILAQTDYLLGSNGTSVEMPESESPEYMVVPAQALQPPAEIILPQDAAPQTIVAYLPRTQIGPLPEAAEQPAPDIGQVAQQKGAAIFHPVSEPDGLTDAFELETTPMVETSTAETPLVETKMELPVDDAPSTTAPEAAPDVDVSIPRDTPVRPTTAVPVDQPAGVLEADLPAARRAVDPVQQARPAWEGIIGEAVTRGEAIAVQDAPAQHITAPRPWVFTPVARDNAAPQHGIAGVAMEVVASDLPPVQSSDASRDSLRDRPSPESLWMPLTTEVRIPGANAALHASASNGHLPPEQVISTRVISQIVRSAKVNLTEAGGDISLRLDPPHLGLVRMNVSTVDGTVTATIQTSTETAKQVLSADVSVLKQALADAGVRVDSIDVSVGADLNQSWGPHTGTHGGPAWGESRGHGSSTPRFLGRESGQDSTYTSRSQAIGGFDYLA